MSQRKNIFKRILQILIILSIIYFGLGLVSSVIMMVMESSSQVISKEFHEDYPVKIIYIALGGMALLCAGFITALYIGYYHLRKSMKKKN